jgi:hypothetical protein
MRPVGIIPIPPEMGGAVMSFAGGPTAIAFGSFSFCFGSSLLVLFFFRSPQGDERKGNEKFRRVG